VPYSLGVKNSFQTREKPEEHLHELDHALIKLVVQEIGGATTSEERTRGAPHRFEAESESL